MRGGFTMRVGEAEVTTIADGWVEHQAFLLTGATDEQLVSILGAEGRSASARMSYNAFLVRIGGRRILIDTGMGEWSQTTPRHEMTGRVAASLAATGTRPEQIDDVCITHVHFDHIGGLIDGDSAAFPRAILRVPESELRYLETLMADPMYLEFTQGRSTEAVEPYRTAGRLAPFDGDADLGDGLVAVSMSGHTPGHTGYRIGRGADSILFIGDLVHWGSVQFPHPDAFGGSDLDPEAANAQRHRVFGLAADEGFWLAGAHLPFPGIGRVRRDGDGYAWIPVS